MKHKNRDNQKSGRTLRQSFIFAVLSFVMLITVVIQPITQIASAETTKIDLASGYGVYQTLMSKYYFYSIESCLSSLSEDSLNGGAGAFTMKDIRNYEWFKEMNRDPSGNSPRDVIAVSYLEQVLTGKADDGKIYCRENSNSLLTSAFSLWGLTKEVVLNDLICSGGGKDGGLFYLMDPDAGEGVNCRSYGDDAQLYFNHQDGENNGFKRATDVFKDFIVDRVYNGNPIPLQGVNIDESPLSEAESYWLYYNIVGTFCADLTTLVPKTDDQSADGEEMAINLVEPDGDHIDINPYWVEPTTEWNTLQIPVWQASDSTNYQNQIDWGYPRAVGPKDISAMVIVDCRVAISFVNGDAQAYKDATTPEEVAKAIIEVPYNPTEEDTTTCAVEGIGWIICPVVNFLAKIVDGSWNVLVGFLQTNPSIVSTTKEDGSPSSTYQVWQVVRNIANVAFVIVFLIIIFSQITSFGISNYGIKKMLPKLIIAAILVNLSYYICQIAVDVSNILGFSIKSIFDNFADGIIVASPNLSDGTTGAGFAGIAGVALVGVGVALYASLGVLIPVLLGGIVALIMILFMLIGRQALIVLLIIMSPLAFVAYLLPNTEKLFDKWKKLSMSLLMLFPIVALVMGASSLASKILTSVFLNSTPQASLGAVKMDTTLGQIAGAAVAILPLFVVPGMLKKSLDGVGNIGANLNKLSDKWGKGAGSKYTNSGYAKNYAAKKADKQSRIATGNYKGKWGNLNPNNLRSGLNSRLNRSGAFNAATSGFGAQRNLAAQAQDRKDRQDTMAMFNNNDELVSAWAETGGDMEKLKKYNDSLPATKKLDPTTMAQFKLMNNAGYHKKFNSHIAAAQYMSENGKGSAGLVGKAIKNAENNGGDNINIRGAQNSAVAAYRKNGRGDALAELSTSIGRPMTGEQGWAEVDPAGVHRDGVKLNRDTTGSVIGSGFVAGGGSGAESYYNYLNTNDDNTVSALRAYDKMESRAKKDAGVLILKAAQDRAVATGMTPAKIATITDIETAKKAFGVIV